MRHKGSLLARRARLMVALTLGLVLFSVAPLQGVHAAAGDLDPGFGAGGKTMLDFAGVSEESYAMAIQPDGKIILAGFTISGDTQHVAVVRLDGHGNLDPTFAAGGKAILDVQGFAYGVAVQPDGKIVVAGTSNARFLVLRLDANGNLDSGPAVIIIGDGKLGFGKGGIVTTDFGSAFAEARAVAIQPDGKIVVAGRAMNPDTGMIEFALARYDAYGDLDAGFGGGGKLMTRFTNLNHQVTGLVLLPKGRILMVGSAFTNAGNAGLALACFKYDGRPYELFGVEGKVLTEFKGLSALANAVVVQPDGKILVGGSIGASPTPQSDGVLARYDCLGQPDPSFGIDGIVIVDRTKGGEPIFSLALQRDARIVAASSAFISESKSAFMVERFEAQGDPDLTFGSYGKVTTEFPGNAALALSVAVLGEGSIIAAGYAGDSAGNLDFAVACYATGIAPPPPPPVTFNICLQDDANGNFLKVNSTTGEYLFTNCSTGLTVGGKGTIRVVGCKIFLDGVTRDRSISALINVCTHVGAASMKDASLSKPMTIADSNMTNNTCGCK